MSLIIEVKVIPSSGQQKWILDKSGQLKCYLKSPPEKGKANKELIKLLANALKCSQHEIEIISGLSSRKKKIKIDKALSYENVLKLLNLKTGQQSLF